ncbi:MAG: hypothetical protein OXF60_06355 [Gammaproteobacteria bacterium]|nr:hypothetical protein [Gammaproteobacteria bacterium]
MHHPQGWHRAPCGLIQYWIISSAQGILGGINFSAATFQLAPRNQMIGVSNEACIANIGQVVWNRNLYNGRWLWEKQPP